jgi:hypothetical protein
VRPWRPSPCELISNDNYEISSRLRRTRAWNVFSPKEVCAPLGVRRLLSSPASGGHFLCSPYRSVTLGLCLADASELFSAKLCTALGRRTAPINQATERRRAERLATGPQGPIKECVERWSGAGVGWALALVSVAECSSPLAFGHPAPELRSLHRSFPPQRANFIWEKETTTPSLT